ncbi:MAG: phosphatase PAP2 family protein [Clostridiaceae bacterium]|nr:phosphatase PAP2 family protein [Clostridiaceae bacterium]
MNACVIQAVLGADMWEWIYFFDDAVYKFVSGFISDDMTRIMKFFTFLGSGWTIAFLTVLLPFFIFVLRKKKYYRMALALTANIALGALFNQLLKHLFLRPRPDILRLIEISGYSFPSGHSMNSLIFYGFIVYLLVKNGRHWSRYMLAGAVGLIVLLIGISRIYLGVHYASDVLAGFMIGFGWLVLAARITKKLHFDTSRHTA